VWPFSEYANQHIHPKKLKIFNPTVTKVGPMMNRPLFFCLLKTVLNLSPFIFFLLDNVAKAFEGMVLDLKHKSSRNFNLFYKLLFYSPLGFGCQLSQQFPIWKPFVIGLS
jgi:hypothetical protein